VRLDQLAAHLRRAGLDVVEVPGWRNRGHGDFTAIKSIVCHHTAGPAVGSMPSLKVVTQGRSDLAGPLCNLALGRDGTVYVVSAGVAWHAGKVKRTEWDNQHAIGIEAEATGTDAWPEVQMDAYARLCKALMDRYELPLSAVLGHKEVCDPTGRKIDPNFNMGDFRQRIADLDKPETPTVVSRANELVDQALALYGQANAGRNVVHTNAAKIRDARAAMPER